PASGWILASCFNLHQERETNTQVGEARWEAWLPAGQHLRSPCHPVTLSPPLPLPAGVLLQPALPVHLAQLDLAVGDREPAVPVGDLERCGFVRTARLLDGHVVIQHRNEGVPALQVEHPLALHRELESPLVTHGGAGVLLAGERRIEAD